MMLFSVAGLGTGNACFLFPKEKTLGGTNRLLHPSYKPIKLDKKFQFRFKSGPSFFPIFYISALYTVTMLNNDFRVSTNNPYELRLQSVL